MPEFGRGPTYIRGPLRSMDWVGYETEILPRVPREYVSTVSRWQERKAASTRNTIAGDDTDRWNRVVGEFDSLVFTLISRLDDPLLRGAELAEAQKCTVMNSSELAGLKPNAVSEEVAPPGVSSNEWREYLSDGYNRYRMKRGFKIPEGNEMLIRRAQDVLRQIRSAALDDELAAARTDTNAGWPTIASSKEAHDVGAALAYVSRSYTEMVDIGTRVAEELQGVELGPVAILGTRTSENRRDQELVERTVNGLMAAGDIVGGARQRDIFMVNRAFADVLRLPSRYALQVLKYMFPNMDLKDPSDVGAKVEQFLGTGEKREGDGSAFDSNVSEEALREFNRFLLAFVEVIHPDRVDLAAAILEECVGGDVMVPGSQVPNSAALRSVQGLMSGCVWTSVVSNWMQCLSALNAAVTTYNVTYDVAFDMAADRAIPANWYGDDTLFRYEEDGSRDYADRHLANLAMMGQNYVVEPGEVLLRTYRGHRLLVRMWWRSIDSERPVLPEIRDLGTAVRFMTLGPHPQRELGWWGVRRMRALAGVQTPATPEQLYLSAHTALLSSQRGRVALGDWLSEAMQKPYWDAVRAITGSDSSRLLMARTFERRMTALTYIERYVARRGGSINLTRRS